MRLVVTTPTAVVTDVRNVRQVRAEDDTGGFGILKGHADFLTVLPVSVVTWESDEAGEGFVLVRGGLLTVHAGELVEIAARGAYSRDDLASLGRDAIAELERRDEEDDVARTSESRLHLATMRQIQRVLESGRGSVSSPPNLQPDRAEAGS